MKYQHLNFLFILTFVFVVGMSSGCRDASRPADLPTLYPCTLTFKQEGNPLADAMIFLEPVDKSSKWSVTSITNEAGVAKIVTHGQFPGAPQGEYVIVISKEENEQENANRKVVDDLGNEMDAGGIISTFTCVEKIYTDAKTSPLKYTVAKGKNAQEFECGKAARVLLRKVAP